MTHFMLQEQTIEREVYTVSRLNLEVRLLLDGSFPPLWVEGEISNLRKPGSGHIYFILKDESAQVRCAMFRMRNNQLHFQPKDGMQILVRAHISLYEERGDYQLIVDYMEEAGDGALRRAFEILKNRLAAEGLFNSEHKKPIPSLPKCIGVITSPTGAAIRDILSVLQRRFPSIPVIIYPTLVQGNEAADYIVQALKIANQRNECDVLILTRGGGSLEDLWPFNEERVARAIFASKIAVVSAVGHEIDFTIADFVADQRAATPSAAAELVSPDYLEWFKFIAQQGSRLKHLIHTHIQQSQLLLHNLRQRLQHPGRRLQDQAQRLDGLEQRLYLAQKHLLKHQLAVTQHLLAKLQRYTPIVKIQQLTMTTDNLALRLKSNMQHQLMQSQQKLATSVRALDTVNPLNTLQRGYAIISKNETIITSTQQVKPNDKLQARVADGILNCIVESVS